MLSEFALRVAMAVTFIPALAIGVYFRRRSSTGEKLDRIQEGLPILILLRLAGLTLWIAIFWWVFDPRALDWARLPVPEWLRWLGIPLFIAVFAWIIWVFRTLGHNLTDTVVTRKSATMITSGPYRLVRNPLYTAIMPIGLAVTLIQSLWLPFAASAFIFCLLVLRTQKEEANLIARFGDDYLTYMRTTPRYFPKVGA
jgi:protein-S-isoprenylcysteine O-methyltransferase Ste14